EEVHAFVNDLERPVGTYLYGRRMYETMHNWETAHTIAGQPPVSLDFARIWQTADKIVYSTTLQEPDTARTRIERDFDPEQGPQAQVSGRPRPHGRRRAARGAGNRGRAGGRVPAVRRAGRRRRRHPVPARPGPPESGAGAGAQV